MKSEYPSAPSLDKQVSIPYDCVIGKPLFAWLPVETVIKERQEEYYNTLAKADKSGTSTVFIEFMLESLVSGLSELPDSDQVTDQVKALLKVLGNKELRAAELRKSLELSHRPTFSKNYLNPALEKGLVARDHPDSPRSPKQRYKLTPKGKMLLRKKK